MKYLALSLLPIAMFLAWGIGGEYRFGKGKRGLLLAIPLTIVGWFYIVWWGLALQVGILYIIYQCLFYDDGIAMVYEKHDPLGWLVIGLNGAMIGLTGVMFGVAGKSYSTILMGVLVGIIGFVLVVKLSNEPKFSAWRFWLNQNGKQYLPYIDDKGNKGFYINGKDAWWVSEAIMGGILGIALVMCLI